MADIVIPATVGAALTARIETEDLSHDAGQMAVVAALDDLITRLANAPKRRWFSGLARRAEPVTGLYIHGGVGRGKTMLMDMFHKVLASSDGEIRPFRLHFHDFMVMAQDAIHAAREEGADDPIAMAADRLAARGRVMCFDEMEVRDIADAMILARLFTTLFDRGIADVMTEARQIVGEAPTYCSFDIDFIDPSFAPGTGTPVIGGLASWQGLECVRGLEPLHLIGMDLVEVAPAYDHAEITAIAAASIAYDWMAVVAKQRGAVPRPLGRI